MRQLRVVMQPIRSQGSKGSVIVSGFELGFSPLGRAIGPTIAKASATLELFFIVIDKVRLDERTDPASLATFTGALSLSGGTADFALSGPPQQEPSLTDVVEQGGHRRPRRKLQARMPGGTDIPLLLPDVAQVSSGFMEVTAKLTVNGEVHGDVAQNEVLDVPLLPLSATHAIFHFVDAINEPLVQLSASFQSSEGDTLQAVTDDFGELYLNAAQGQTYTLLEVLPADDDRVAIVEASVADSALGSA